MLDVVRKLAPRVEYYSIDEFFFEAWPNAGQSHQAYAEAIRDRINREVGVPVTVGIARSKSLAKLISDTAKPFGALAVLDAKAEENLLASRPVSDVTGIAKRRAARLAGYGIRTCLDFARARRPPVRSLLTATGEALWWELRGDPVQPLHTNRPPHKALARGGSLGETTTDPTRLWAWIVRNLERLVEELQYHTVRVGKLTVHLLNREGYGTSGDVILHVPTDRFDLLMDAARRAFLKALIPGFSATHTHVIATHLQYRSRCVQRGLFDPPAERAEAVALVKREINARCGRFAVRSGATLYLTEVYRDKAQSYDICDVHGKTCF
jgi:nucleotidyltransferase/DNA polymerase involved in DNA repair